MQQIFDRLQAMLSRKFLLALATVLLITFGVDADPKWVGVADAIVGAIYIAAQAYQNSKLPK